MGHDYSEKRLAELLQLNITNTGYSAEVLLALRVIVGHLAEGCASNLFIVRRRALYTASACEGILPGVVRDLVLAAARAAGLLVHEGRVRVVRLQRADEAFLTSSLRAVRPLVRYAGRPIGNGEPGPITAMLGRAVARSRRRTSVDDA